MGMYVNPGNDGFKRILNSGYVDKTEMIALLNSAIDTTDNLICVSRPRRFGKSFAAKMLSAYYDCSCNSDEFFFDKKIARDSHYEDFLNKYNVICFDVTSFVSEAKWTHRPLRDVPNMIVEALLDDVKAHFPYLSEEKSLTSCLLQCAEGTEQYPGKRFVFIIDEWDALIREAKNEPDTQDIYLHLLREWFKNINFTPKVVAAAYMTGILPIKKDGSQSAISDFEEFTMIKPRQFAAYVGFTEEEVRSLCEKDGLDFQMMRQWYDGYDFPGVGPVYNPNSVIKALKNDDFDSYWTETSAAEGLMEYISRDYTGLTKTIAELIGGVDVPVNTTGFANDLTTFKGKDDVLTLLIHLGYLAYDSRTKTVRIPNEEIRREFRKSVREIDHRETIRRLRESERKMKRVITYGTFDLLHYGHINLLRRAKALGDYLIVALSTDEFTWNEKRKKCYFSYEQRKALVEAIRYVDLVIPEENWEQKRTDVHEYHIDTFVMGDDWAGKFDFLREEGCEVVYLPRTPEISTTQIKTDLKS